MEESPFKWQIPAQATSDSDWLVKKLTEKLNYMVDDEGVFKWCRYTKLLVLVYEHMVREETDLALQHLQTCEDILLEPQNTKDQFYVSIEKSLWHVFLAAKAELAKKGLTDVTEKEKITPFNEMNNDEKAGLLGIKTSVFMAYGPFMGIRMLPTIREAIRLSPLQAEWYYREGCILREQRRTCDHFSKDRDSQFGAFQRAFELNKQNASYALCYASAMRYVGFAMRPSDVGYDALWKKVIGLYNLALELRSECPYTLINISKGFKSFPPKYQDWNKVEQLILKAERGAPNNHRILHDVGLLYRYHLKDQHKACEYFKRAMEQGSFGAVMTYIRTALSLDFSFDAIPTLETAHEKFKADHHRVEILINMGFFHFLFTEDVGAAMEKFLHILQTYPDNKLIKSMKPIGVTLSEAVSLLEFLHNFLNTTRRAVAKREEILALVYAMEPALRNSPASHRYWKTRYGIWAKKPDHRSFLR